MVCKEVAKTGQMWAVVHGSRVLELGGQTGSFARPMDGPLALAQPDRAIARVNRQRLASAIHLPVNLRVAEGAFHSDRNAQTDVAVTGAGVNIGLEIRRKNEVHASITSPDGPAWTWTNLA